MSDIPLKDRFKNVAYSRDITRPTIDSKLERLNI